MTRLRSASVFCLAATMVAGCLVFVRKVDVKEVMPDRPPAVVETPLKAHLINGHVAVFEDGAIFSATHVSGEAVLYDLNLQSSSITSLPLDSVAAFETFSTAIDGGRTLKMSAIATAIPVAIIGVVCAADPKACFGSCPTVYSNTDRTYLEAESFSNSISRLLETRDIDRLNTKGHPTGTVSLEVRNEALETHYINHIELLSVDHDFGERAVSVRNGKALVVGELVDVKSAVDQAGRLVTGVLAAVDGDAYRTDEPALAQVTEDRLFDHIDLSFGALARDSVALVLTLRNSLLNTVLFYDFMLAQAGPKSLDWLAKDMESIGQALSVGDLYMERMGIRISTWNGQTFDQVTRLGNTGPIAWDELGVVVPVLPGDARVRLSFLADSWRIDHVAVSPEFRTTAFQVHAPHSITVDDVEDDEALERIAYPDDSYLMTFPTDRFEVNFRIPAIAETSDRTLFLSAQGYYTEWIRRQWVTNLDGRPFEATDQSLLQAVQRWKEVRPEFESLFVNTRLPYR